MLYSFDEDIQRAGYHNIAGIDEAGRGPLAGPVCVAAVILDLEKPIEGLNDSKKLTEKKREALYEEIIRTAKAYSIEYGELAEIEEYNILGATLGAMSRAASKLSITPDLLLIDGNVDIQSDIPTQLIIKGDATSASIAAASILAKVTRDRLLVGMAEKYPEYKFEQHKGYPTKLHYEMLDKFGPCDMHRKSFLKKWEAKREAKH